MNLNMLCEVIVNTSEWTNTQPYRILHLHAANSRMEQALLKSNSEILMILQKDQYRNLSINTIILFSTLAHTPGG